MNLHLNVNSVYRYSVYICTHLVFVIAAGPLYVIVEYAPYGNLREFLRERRAAVDGFHDDAENQQNSSLTYRDLLSFAFQVARGLEYMSSRMVNVTVISCKTCLALPYLHFVHPLV